MLCFAMLTQCDVLEQKKQTYMELTVLAVSAVAGTLMGAAAFSAR
jgi:hypothetical protein